MTDAQSDPDMVLTEDEAADLLAISPATLAELRRKAVEASTPEAAPPFRRLGKVVRYSRSAVLAWLAAGGSAK